MDEFDITMPYSVPTNWKGNAPLSGKKQTDKLLLLKGKRLFNKRDGLPCGVCNVNRAWLTVDPFHMDVYGEEVPCVLCEECEEDIAADI